MVKYRHNPQPEEKYIDLLPIPNYLYINARDFFEANQGRHTCTWLVHHG
jgi:hypothetical protein